MEQSLTWDTFLFITPVILGLLLGVWSTLAHKLHWKISSTFSTHQNPPLERLGKTFGLGLGMDSEVMWPLLLSSLGVCGLLLDALLAPLLTQAWLDVPVALLLSLFLTAQIGQGMGHSFAGLHQLER